MSLSELASLGSFVSGIAVPLHKSLRITPAMAGGVSDGLWTLEELVEQISR